MSTSLPKDSPPAAKLPIDPRRVHLRTPIVRNAYLAFLKRWASCTECPLNKRRRSVVQFRGTLPCRVLFVGEAPGESEDSLGYPFVGPAGTLLDDLIYPLLTYFHHDPSVGGIAIGDPKITYGICNIVSCIPLDKPDKYSSGEIRPPTRDEAEACQPRLQELLKIAKPDLIVTLGDVAKRFLPPREIRSSRSTGKSKPAILHLMHPSKILKMDQPSQQVREEKRFLMALTTALENL